MDNDFTREVAAKVKQVLQTTFRLAEEKLVPEANLRDDLGLDSIDLFDLMGSLEKEYGVEVDHADFNGVETLQGLVDRLGILLTKEQAKA